MCIAEMFLQNPPFLLSYSTWAEHKDWNHLPLPKLLTLLLLLRLTVSNSNIYVGMCKRYGWDSQANLIYVFIGGWWASIIFGTEVFHWEEFSWSFTFHASLSSMFADLCSPSFSIIFTQRWGEANGLPYFFFKASNSYGSWQGYNVLV